MNDWVMTQKEELRSDFLKLVLYELNNAVSPREKRIGAIQAAIDEFNHNNFHKHDQELELQADKILFQKMAYCFAVHKHDEEMGLIACALEMVYRANRGRVALSFQEIGDSILPLFVEMIRWSSARRKDIWITTHLRSTVSRNLKIDETPGPAGDVSNEGPYTKPPQSTQVKTNTNDNQHHLKPLHHSQSSKVGNSSNFSTNQSLVSILKTGEPMATVQENPAQETPIRSNTKSILRKLPDELPEDIPEDTEFTIECIPNGTETSSFNPDDLENDKLRGDVDKCGGQEEASTASTSTTDEIENSPTSQASPDVPPSRQRQVRFSIGMEAPSKDFTPLTGRTGRDKSEPMKESGVMDRLSHDNHTKIRDDSESGGESSSNLHHVSIEQQMIWKKERFTHPLAVLKVLKIVRYFSRVLSAMVPMAFFPGLLDELIFQMKIRKGGADGRDGILRSKQGRSYADDDTNTTSSHGIDSISKTMHADDLRETNELKGQTKRKNPQYLDNACTARMDAIATVVNLACAEENKIKLLRHPGLLDAVIHVAQNDFIDGAREHASIVLMNLALADDNKMAMANYDNLLSVIIKLTTDNTINTRRYASATILNLVGIPENTYCVAKFGKGRLLHALTRVLATDDVEEIRINIAETFFNLVRNSTDLNTIELIGRHRDVFPCLSSTVLSDYSADVRAYAARTLEWLAADIHFGSNSHPALLDALIKASMWTKTNCVVEALKAQATIAENRIAMVQREGMLDTLASLASLHGVNDEEVRECALATIERLTCEPYVRKTMASHKGIMVELTRATFSKSGILDQYEENDGVSRALMKSALKNLANEI